MRRSFRGARHNHLWTPTPRPLNRQTGMQHNPPHCRLRMIYLPLPRCRHHLLCVASPGRRTPLA
eukprot:2431268-Pleurochrysis_carterae.AAC.1